MSKKILLLSLAALCCAVAAAAQTRQVASVVHTQYTIESKALGETRTILVRVPADYERTNARYPVVYMTDAHPPQNAMMAGLIEQQAWGGQMPEMILVGLQNTNRARDLTPVDDGQGGAVGGAPKFLEFIATEVVPLVEKNYRTEPFRIFAGHSLGGLFAVYAMTQKPDLFNAYIAASPVLGYADNYVLKRVEEMLRTDREWRKTLFVSIADEPDFAKGFNALQDLLKKAKPKKFDYEFREFRDETHASSVLPAYYAGLRKIFAGWRPSASGTVAELENHYKKLSERFGYRIPVPETTFNQIGYQFLRAGNYADALAVFKKNVENHPYSANCLDSLAEAEEKSGDLRAARDDYEKAYKMAEAHGETGLAQTARANFERLAAKLK
ncbi:MAG: tetratricopeptide repeat protein [Acidobacteria bacterium]|nr:tetratricopeptide repeat protein [Acidobacteriota bacterium]